MGKTRYIALSRKVIAVAIEGEVKDWAAYIDGVPGDNHFLEAKEVARTGTKLPQKVAEILFPDFASEFSWRD
jgi:hypothetical protein